MNSRLAPVLQNDERAVISNRVPLVVHERRGAVDRPLTVFLPGAIHLARVAYGHEGSRPDDFLAHWFERAGQPFDEEQDRQIREMVQGQIEKESYAFFATARIWDDGIIDPRDTRTVLGICLSALHSNEIRGTTRYGVFRM